MASLGDGRHFVVGSLYYPSLNACADNLPAQGTVAVSIATVNTAGTAATFSPPVEVAQAGDVCLLNGTNPPPDIATLDKDFLSYDPASRTLAVSFTRFFITGTHSGNGQVEVARAHMPASPTALTAASFGTPITERPRSSRGPTAGSASPSLSSTTAEATLQPPRHGPGRLWRCLRLGGMQPSGCMTARSRA